MKHNPKTNLARQATNRWIWLFFTILLLCSCKGEENINVITSDGVDLYTSWPDGIVHYYYEGDFSNNEIENIEEAMQIWQGAANINFIQNRCTKCLQLEKTSGRSGVSYLGKPVSESQPLFYVGNNISVATAVHELGHVLGLIHEHQRADRNDYVEIHWDEVSEEEEVNFKILEYNMVLDPLSFEYDASSIMHYSKCPELSFLEGVSRQLVSGYLTETDKEKVRQIYGE